MIWEGLHKIWHCGLQKLEFGVYDDDASFKYGKKASKVVTWFTYEEKVNRKRKSLSRSVKTRHVVKKENIKK